jgi:hypothetical protein
MIVITRIGIASAFGLSSHNLLLRKEGFSDLMIERFLNLSSAAFVWILKFGFPAARSGIFSSCLRRAMSVFPPWACKLFQSRFAARSSPAGFDSKAKLKPCAKVGSPWGRARSYPAAKWYWLLRPGIFVCGEYGSLPSIQWALLSGRLAAEAILAALPQRKNLY